MESEKRGKYNKKTLKDWVVKEKEKVGLDLEFAEIFGELNTLIKKDTPYINSNNNVAFSFCH